MHASTPHVRRSLRHVVLAPAIGGLVAFALVGCGPKVSKISVRRATVPVPATADSAAVYLSIANDGDLDDELLSVSTPAASLTTLHETSIDASGRATMKAVGTLVVPAGATVDLRPGGLHLMMMQPRALAAGDRVELTLTFRHAGAVRVTATVVADVDESMGS